MRTILQALTHPIQFIRYRRAVNRRLREIAKAMQP